VPAAPLLASDLRRIQSSSIEKTTERIRPAPCLLRTYHEKRPAMNDPATPSRMVPRIPIGSGPGSSRRASAPTTRPTATSRIRKTMSDTGVLAPFFAGAGRLTTVQPEGVSVLPAAQCPKGQRPGCASNGRAAPLSLVLHPRSRGNRGTLELPEGTVGQTVGRREEDARFKRSDGGSSKAGQERPERTASSRHGAQPR
jgi:hypothetical protein